MIIKRGASQWIINQLRLLIAVDDNSKIHLWNKIIRNLFVLLSADNKPTQRRVGNSLQTGDKSEGNILN